MLTQLVYLRIYWIILDVIESVNMIDYTAYLTGTWSRSQLLLYKVLLCFCSSLLSKDANIEAAACFLYSSFCLLRCWGHCWASCNNNFNHNFSKQYGWQLVIVTNHVAINEQCCRASVMMNDYYLMLCLIHGSLALVKIDESSLYRSAFFDSRESGYLQNQKSGCYQIVWNLDSKPSQAHP